MSIQKKEVNSLGYQIADLENQNGKLKSLLAQNVADNLEY